MQAKRTVTLYRGNRIDAAEDFVVDDLVSEFIDYALNDAEPTGRPLAFAFRLWITDPNGHNAVADESDLQIIEAALAQRLHADTDLFDRVLERVVG